MTIAVDLGRKARKQTNKQKIFDSLNDYKIFVPHHACQSNNFRRP